MANILETKFTAPEKIDKINDYLRASRNENNRDFYISRALEGLSELRAMLVEYAKDKV